VRTTAEIREGYLSYFESKGHERLPSWPLIPRPEDRSTLLTSAGMQPQMPYFLGREAPPAPLTTTVQKCFRTPDIDEVGLDGHHLTFFEMLGNFSFGRYFKEGAIELAWEFLNEHLEIEMDRFWVTVFAGDPQLGLGPDEVAAAHWEKVGVPVDRIRYLGRAHNFWSVGGPGPCGPDTEMYYDRGEALSCGRDDCGPGCECERYLEFWNLVFMEYELHPDGSLTPLPKQNVDTGMGLERTATIQQGVVSIYETDGYQEIMSWIADESGVAYGESDRATKAHRIIADHGRGMTCLVGDGVLPSNEGRGYVLRRVVRRAVLQARTVGLEDLWRISDVVVDQMGRWYPELPRNREQIRAVLRTEEERFGQTLERGLKLFEEVAARGGDIAGEEAFRLHDTYGFPIELTRELAEERALGVNEEEFTKLMAEQRERSRAGTGRAEVEAARFAAEAGFETEFVGYEKTEVLTQIGALEELEPRLVLAKLRESPFYPAGGGQVTDAGFVERDGGGPSATVREAYRVGDDQVLLLEGEGLAAGDRVRAVVSWPHRFPTMANHTATHLLHAALRETLGDHVRQAGSAVRPDKLRFDFTHGQALSPDERARIEARVNQKIFENLPVHTFVTPLEEARKLGATMLFGEKYGEHVRLVEIPGFSRELCGGTHVRRTAEIGPFVIVGEGSVGAGARRIEAITAGEAYAHLEGRAREAEELREELERTRKEAKRGGREEGGPGAAPAEVAGEREREVGGVRVFVARVENADAERLLEVSDREKQRRSPAAVVLGTAENGTVHLVANFDEDVAKRVSASDVIREAAAVVGGGGGGRPTMARAGGKRPERLDEALDTAERLIADALA
jgi:alanyl-tRNA synthetase